MAVAGMAVVGDMAVAAGAAGVVVVAIVSLAGVAVAYISMRRRPW